MSVGVVDKTTGDRIPTAGNPLDKVGNLANLTTTAKGSAVEAIDEVNETKANQAQLATVEASTTASKAYNANDYLVLGGVLYKVTANIAQGGTIVTEGADKNVDLATVGGELNAINSNIASFEAITEVTGYSATAKCTLDSGFAYRSGNVVAFQFTITKTAYGWDVVEGMPKPATPTSSGELFVSAVNDTGNLPVKCYINYNGTVCVVSENSGTFIISGTYLTKE